MVKEAFDAFSCSALQVCDFEVTHSIKKEYRRIRIEKCQTGGDQRYNVAVYNKEGNHLDNEGGIFMPIGDCYNLPYENIISENCDCAPNINCCG